MTVRHCESCGARIEVRSVFEESCPECGSEHFVDEDAWDPPEFELVCQHCGFETNVAQRPDPNWVEGSEAWPESVDDPCPVCSEALTPQSESQSVRARPEYGLAKKAAARTRKRHCRKEPPFDPKEALRAVGVSVEFGAFDHDGLLIDTVVQVPDDQHPVVQRFTLAHELGHFVLGHTGDRLKTEPEANAFASEFLIPRDLLRAEVGAGISLPALKRKFNVSTEATTRAVIGAGLAGRISPD